MKAFIYRRKSQEDKDRQALSLENQERAVARLLEQFPDLDIVEDLHESRTAAKPGRPVFEEMLRRIDAGEAECIVSWAPDRLSRNPIDAGRIVHMLDLGTLTDLKFVTYTFENTPAGKFMLQMMLVQSKYYSDALSVNVKEGINTRLAHGWQAGPVPIGYKHDKESKTVVRDAERFPLVQQIFSMTLAGTHSPRQIHRVASEQWGLTTPKTKREGGKPLCLSAIYKILANPFYAGVIVRKGKAYKGSHELVLPLSEFDEVQRRLGRPETAKPKRYSFSYTGLIHCACGLMITAETKTKPSGRTYSYYHCTRRKNGARCRQPAVPTSVLEMHMQRFLGTAFLHPTMCIWLSSLAQWNEDQERAFREAKQTSLGKALGDLAAQISRLTQLRLRDLVSDEEFAVERKRLEFARYRLEDELGKPEEARTRIELVQDVIWFSIQAVELFLRPDPILRRLVLETVGSNPVLENKIFKAEAAKPFQQMVVAGQFLQWCGSVEDIRTPHKDDDIHKVFVRQETKQAFREWMDKMAEVLAEPESEPVLRNIRRIRELCAPWDDTPKHAA